HIVQANQGGDVEGQVHDLDQREETAGDRPRGGGDFEFGMHCDRRDRRVCGWRDPCTVSDNFVFLQRRISRFVRSYGSNEPISAAGERFHVARAGGGVSQGFAYLVDGGIQTVVEVDEGVG